MIRQAARIRVVVIALPLNRARTKKMPRRSWAETYRLIDFVQKPTHYSWRLLLPAESFFDGFPHLADSGDLLIRDFQLLGIQAEDCALAVPDRTEFVGDLRALFRLQFWDEHDVSRPQRRGLVLEFSVCLPDVCGLGQSKSGHFSQLLQVQLTNPWQRTH